MNLTLDSMTLLINDNDLKKKPYYVISHREGPTTHTSNHCTCLDKAKIHTSALSNSSRMWSAAQSLMTGGVPGYVLMMSTTYLRTFARPSLRLNNMFLAHEERSVGLGIPEAVLAAGGVDATAEAAADAVGAVWGVGAVAVGAFVAGWPPPTWSFGRGRFEGWAAVSSLIWFLSSCRRS